MNTVPRLFLIAALCGLLLIGGFFAYNAGVSRGLEQNAQNARMATPAGGPTAQPYPYPYPPSFGWHHHHGGFGFFLFPFFFFAFWLFVMRGHFGRRGFRRGGGCGPDARLDRFDERHRRAHERLGDPLPNVAAER